jgi:hypothetical protein
LMFSSKSIDGEANDNPGREIAIKQNKNTKEKIIYFFDIKSSSHYIVYFSPVFSLFLSFSTLTP